jgi:DNA-binding NarL/FixJ family response regulator
LCQLRVEYCAPDCRTVRDIAPKDAVINRPKVLLVDDHKIVAEGLVQLLSDHADVLDIISDGNLVLDAIVRWRPDVVILDISLPGISGLEVIRQIRAHRLEPKIIVLTMCAEAMIAVEALRAGAAGFVLKASGGEELLTALETVLNGQLFLTATLTKEIVTLMVDARDSTEISLSGQQREVLRLIVRGQRLKEVATTMGLSPRTIVGVKHKLMHRLQVSSTAELVRYALEHRLVPF